MIPSRPLDDSSSLSGVGRSSVTGREKQLRLEVRRSTKRLCTGGGPAPLTETEYHPLSLTRSRVTGPSRGGPE